MKNGAFGINMKQFRREHEARVATAPPELMEEHLRMITWIQHERLVHLIVTFMVVICELFTVGVVLATGNVVAAAVMLGLAVLLGFYFYHYFFLENTLQRWYRIAGEMRAKLKEGMDEAEDRSIQAGSAESGN